MKLNRKAKVFLTATLTSVSCAGFIIATAASAQAREVQGRSPHRHAVAQRVERAPEPPKRVERAPEPPTPEPRSPARLTIYIE